MSQGRWMVMLVVGCMAGCTSFIARQIEHPGHSSSRAMDELLSDIGFHHDTMRTREGVSIAYWIAPPRGYHFKETFQTRHTEGAAGSISYNIKFDDEPIKAMLLAPKGSVVLLHPWGMAGASMMPWGLNFAAAGYRVVMPDLRSQGESSDAPVGYGPREARDVVELVQQLRAARRLPEPLYLLGASYGATVALFAAAKLSNVRGVIALEPYGNAAAVIRRAPGSGLFGHRWLASWINPQRMDKAIARASSELGVDLANIDPADAVAGSEACTILLRGAHDVLTSDHALRVIARRSARASYVEIPGEGHVSLPLRTDLLSPPLLGWMASLPASGTGVCPHFNPPRSVSASVAPPRRP